MSRMSTLTVPPLDAKTSQVLGYHLLRLRMESELTQTEVAVKLVPKRRPEAPRRGPEYEKAVASIRAQLVKLERGIASDASGLDWLDDIAAIFHVPRAELVTHPHEALVSSHQ